MKSALAPVYTFLMLVETNWIAMMCRQVRSCLLIIYCLGQTVIYVKLTVMSGAMIQQLVMNTLIGLGIDVIDLGLSTTPTVEVAVDLEHADGGKIY